MYLRWNGRPLETPIERNGPVLIQFDTLRFSSSHRFRLRRITHEKQFGRLPKKQSHVRGLIPLIANASPGV